MFQIYPTEPSAVGRSGQRAVYAAGALLARLDVGLRRAVPCVSPLPERGPLPWSGRRIDSHAAAHQPRQPRVHRGPAPRCAAVRHAQHTRSNARVLVSTVCFRHVLTHRSPLLHLGDGPCDWQASAEPQQPGLRQTSNAWGNYPGGERVPAKLSRFSVANKPIS